MMDDLGKKWFNETYTEQRIRFMQEDPPADSFEATLTKEEQVLLHFGRTLGVKTMAHLAEIMCWPMPRLEELYGNHGFNESYVDSDDQGKAYSFCRFCNLDQAGHDELHEKWGKVAELIG